MTSSFQDVPEGGPVTIFQLKDRQYILDVTDAIEADQSTVIKAGDISVIFDNLQHEPAEAIELEAAIADIEDQLMSIINDLPKHRYLVTSEQTIWDIAKVAGLNTDNEIQLDINTVEEIFNRLVDVAYGTPASRLDLPVNREFAATVLFLRELMHHGSYDFIILRH